MRVASSWRSGLIFGLSLALLLPALDAVQASQLREAAIEQPPMGPSVPTQEPTKVATSLDSWNPSAEQLGGLPKDLFIVNEVGVVPDVPIEEMKAADIAEAQSAWKSQGSALSVNLEQVLAGRAGGVATVRVTAPRRNNPGVRVRNLNVRFTPPAGVRVAGAQGDGWRCVRAGCTYSGILGSTQAPPPIDLSLAIAAAVPTGKVTIRATGKWQEQELKNGIGGPTGPAGSFEIVGWHEQKLRDSVELDVDPPLGLTLDSEKNTKVAVTTNGDAASRQTTLFASVVNANDRPVEVSWRQTSGPAVSFVTPANQADVQGITGQTIEVPASMTKVSTPGFEVTAKSQGVAVKKTMKVTVDPLQVGGINPRYGSLAKLATKIKETPTRGERYSTSARDRVQLEAPAAITPGRPTSVSVKSPGVAVSHVKWSAMGGSSAFLDSAKEGAASLGFTMPKQGDPLIVKARIETAAGQTLDRSVGIASRAESGVEIALPPAPKPGEKDRTVVMPTSQDTASSPFCEVFAKIAKRTSASVTLSDGAKLSLPASGSTANGSCASQASSITFNAATLQYGTTSFIGVTGTMTSQGFVISSAKMQLSALLANLPVTRGISQFPVVPVNGSQVGATWTDGKWGAFSGELQVDSFVASGKTKHGLEFLPLPAGWSFAPGSIRLNIAGDGEPGIALTQVAQNETNSTLTFAIDDVSINAPTTMVATVAGIVVTTPRGDDISLQGTASLGLAPGEWPTGQIELNADCGDGGCDVVDGVVLHSAGIVWDRSGTTMKGDLTISVDGFERRTHATGVYVGEDNYSLQIAFPDEFDLGSGVTLTGIAGTVTTKPVARDVLDDGPTSETTVKLSGAVEGINITSAIRNGKVQGSITNECPENAGDACTTEGVRLAIAVTGIADIAGTTSFPVELVGAWDRESGVFSAELAMQDMNVGPKELEISSAVLTLTNDTAPFKSSAGSCSATGSNSQEEDTLQFGFLANAKILDKPIRLGGLVNSAGYCLAGDFGEFTSNGVTISGARVAYSSFDAQFEIPDEDPLPISAGKVIMVGGLEIDGDVVDRLGPAFGGVLQVVAEFNTDLNGFKASVKYDLSTPVYIFGDDEEQSISLSSASLSLQSDGTTTTPSISVNGIYRVPGGADPVNEPASETPVSGSIAMHTDGGLMMMLGADVSNGPINDGFGIKDLKIHNLAIAADLSGGDPISFLGDVVLPQRWNSKFMFVNAPRVRVGFAVNLASPFDTCIEFSVGEPGQTENAFDLGGFGVVTGRYVKLLMAPIGCKLPVGGGEFLTVDPGFALHFDGAVLGAPVEITAEVLLNSDSQIDTVRVNVNLPALELGPVKVTSYDGTDGVDVGVSFRNSDTMEIAANIDGAIVIGDETDPDAPRIRVQGSFEQFASEGVSGLPIRPKPFELSLRGQANIGLFGFDMQNFDVTAKITGKTIMGLTWIDSASVKAKFRADIKAAPFSLNGTVALTYEDGSLLQFYIAVGFGFDFYIASFSGTVIFAYCQGGITDLKDVDGCSPGYRDADGFCKPDAGDHFGVWIEGELHFIFFSISASIEIWTSSEWADGCTNQTLRRPGQPGKPDVVPGNGSATVQVSTPVSGGPPASYLVEGYDSDGNSAGSCTVQASTSPLACTVTGLTNGKVYAFTAKATNATDTSGPSDASDVIVPSLPAGASDPKPPLAAPGDELATVTAVAPSTPSGTIDSYLVTTFDEDGSLVMGKGCLVADPTSSMDCQVSGLTNGELYSFKTTASYEGGASAVSPPSYAVVPRVEIAVPEPPTVYGDDASIEVSVDPSDDPADSYIAKAFTQDPDNAGDYTVTTGTCYIEDVDADQPMCIIEGLENDVPHRVSVRAQVNGLMSAASDLSNVVTPNLPEGTPGVPTPRAGDSSASFEIPAASSGSPLGYGVSVFSQNPDDPNLWTEEAGTCTTSTLTAPIRCTVTGLSNGAKYRARAYATGVERSALSRPSGIFSPQTLPGAMSAPSLVAGNLELSASVNKASSGGDVDYYVVDATNPAGELASSCVVNDPNEEPLTCVLRNLPNDVLYTVTATAHNGAGSTVSAATPGTAPSTLPGVPNPPTAAIGNGNVAVSVTPSSTGGLPRWFDVVTYTSDGELLADRGCTIDATSTPKTCTVNDLTNGSGYQFKAIGRNDVGSSIESAAGTTVIPGPPGTPAAPTAVLRKDSSNSTSAWAQVTVRAGVGGTPTHTNATAYVNGSPVGQCTVTGGAGTCNIYNLRSGSTYVFRATAVSTAGTSAPSAASPGYRAP